MTAEMGWSRNVLLHQIETQAHKRHGLDSKGHYKTRQDTARKKFRSFICVTLQT